MTAPRQSAGRASRKARRKVGSGAGSAELPAPRPYDLGRTLSCGQCFRWSEARGAWYGVFGGTIAAVRQSGERLLIGWEGPPGSPAELARHLGADEPLEEIERRLGSDPVLRTTLSRTSGIAIMRQDPWECLISYIVSAFNNIPKIQGAIRLLARRFGDPILVVGPSAGLQRPGPGEEGLLADERAFPPAGRLAGATLSDLYACALGYRAAYVRAVARAVADGGLDLEAVGRMPYTQARAALMGLPGVGDKVADCVLLFSYGFGEAFPVDVWVQRTVEQWYFGGRHRTPRAIREWARERFGLLAGYAQQHIFTAGRALRPQDDA